MRKAVVLLLKTAKNAKTVRLMLMKKAEVFLRKLRKMQTEIYV